ncbi:MAG: putative Histidine kinase [Nitrosopumilales archaeon]|nr:MAG: putative Histidine kinase [Nitrosopumilales archaeon]
MLEENKFSGSADAIKKLEDELKGNYHALNELRQLNLLIEYYDEKLADKTIQLEKSNKELQKQTQRAEHLAKIGELASSLTHNLRNPLGVISSTVKIIEATSKDTLDEKTLSRLSQITDSTTNMSHQIEEVLNFVREKPLDMETISLSELFKSSINNIGTTERVTIHLPDNEILLECDPPKLEVIFMNLITNSIQAIENTGDIHIRTTEDSGTVTIEIEDSGPGIPSELLPKIFDSLFTTKAAGTGLGLAYCKSTVEQHNGTLTVKNNPTTFTIKFPTKS